MAKGAARAVTGRGWLRIVGGAWRGRKIPVPAGPPLRPTAERAREAIFNRLIHAEAALGVRLRGARIADLFAGTGALGLEALSRGAGAAVFVERDAAAVRALRDALRTLGAEDRGDVLQADAAALPPAPHPVDIVLMDPPYGEPVLTPTLRALTARGWVGPGALIVAELEAGGALELPAGFGLIDRRRYGRAEIAFITVSA